MLFSVQGNCRSSDTTGGRWCYVEGFYCDDIQYSKSRRDRFGELRKWSYQACSTPAPGTGRCAYKPIKPVKPIKPAKPSGIFGGVLGGILKPPKKPTVSITKEPRVALKASVLPEEDKVVFGQ